MTAFILFEFSLFDIEVEKDVKCFKTGIRSKCNKKAILR